MNTFHTNSSNFTGTSLTVLLLINYISLYILASRTYSKLRKYSPHLLTFHITNLTEKQP